jgi:DNA-binding response OmpR family regulator
MKILIVEDDQGLAELLCQDLTHRHYLVDLAADGQAGLALAEAFSYDLILLDFMLPKLDGISLCRQLRKNGDRTPILLLTSENSSTEKVKGLDAGADDYVVKPYDVEELVARIRALLRRGNMEASPIIEWGNLRLDPNSCDVTYGGQLLPLTAKEYSLIELLVRNSQRIFSIRSLLEHLWSMDEAPLENTVRAHIKSLRKKLKQAGGEYLIETVYGLGYRLQRVNGANHQPESPTSSNNRDLSPQGSPEFIHIWERHRETYCHRIALIEQAIAALTEDRLEDALLQQAIREAHTLIGAFGGFGFDEAAQVCRVIEQRLKSGVSQIQGTELRQLVAQLPGLIIQPSTIAPITQLTGSQVKPFQLLIVGQDETWTEPLIAEAKNWGMQGEAIAHVSEARSAIARNRPDIVMLDFDLADSTDHCFELLAELAAFQPPVPAVILTAQADFEHRIKAARLGGRVFLPKPIASAAAMQAIAGIIEQLGPPDSKILIVDDDSQILDSLGTLLKPWGFQLTLLQDPSQFWDILRRTVPDLLILDIEMPALSGIDLCKVVRNEPEWSALPILFLSAHNDSDTVHQVFVAGGDDYVNKPILGHELVARILNRLQRSRARSKSQPSD